MWCIDSEYIFISINKKEPKAALFYILKIKDDFHLIKAELHEDLKYLHKLRGL